MSGHSEVVKAMLGNLTKYATVYAEAYHALTDAGLGAELAVSEARVIAFLAVNPAPDPVNISVPGFGAKVGEA